MIFRRPVFAIALLAAAATGPALAATYHTLIAQGKEAVTLGLFKEGEAIFKQALEEAPGDPEASYGAGFCAQRQGKLSRAAEYYGAVLKSTYNDPALRNFHMIALARMGEIALQRGRYGEAAEIYGQGVENEPGSAEMHYGYGMALRGLRKNEAAFNQFEEALRLDSGMAGAMIGKASILYELGDIPAAFGLLQEAVKADPRSPMPYGVMSRFYEDMQKPYESRIMLGQYYYYLRDYRRAMAEYRAAQVIKETAESHHALGVAYLDTGDPVAAEAKFRRAIEMDIKPVDTSLAQLSHALARQNRLEEAEKTIRKAIKLNPKRGDYFGQLAWILLRQGNPERAVEEARRAIQIAPDLAAPHRYLADALSSLEKYREAIPAYEKSLTLDGAQLEVYINLGWAYESTGDFVSAQRNYELFLKANRDPELADKVKKQIQDLQRRQRR